MTKPATKQQLQEALAERQNIVDKLHRRLSDAEQEQRLATQDASRHKENSEESDAALQSIKSSIAAVLQMRYGVGEAYDPDLDDTASMNADEAGQVRLLRHLYRLADLRPEVPF